MTALAPRRRGRPARPGGRERVGETGLRERVGGTGDPAGPPSAERGSSATRDDGSAAASPSLLDGLSVEPTLDELICGVWNGLNAHQRVLCPMCGGSRAPVYAAHAQPSAGRCEDCGTGLG